MLTGKAFPQGIQKPESRIDSSDDRFTIVSPGGQPAITVLSPSGSEAWAPGSTQTIQWRYTGDLAGEDQVYIAYVRSGSSSWHWIKTAPLGQNGTGSCTWQIPASFIPGNCKIAVRGNSSSASHWQDTSDGFFAIGAAHRYLRHPRRIPSPSFPPMEVKFGRRVPIRPSGGPIPETRAARQKSILIIYIAARWPADGSPSPPSARTARAATPGAFRNIPRQRINAA